MKGLAARPYRDKSDLLAMQALVQRVWTKECHIHIGDLAWQRGRWKAGKPDWPTMLWAIDGVTAAWGWLQLPNELEFLVDPAVPDLIDVVFDWAKSVAQGDQLKVTVLDVEIQLIDALSRRGFQPEDGLSFNYFVRTLDQLPELQLPPGFTVHNPDQSDHQLRRMPITNYGAKRSQIADDADHAHSDW